jgi:hypothetical protein
MDQGQEVRSLHHATAAAASALPDIPGSERAGSRDVFGNTEPTSPSANHSPLLTKRESADFCRVSLRTFERFVQSNLPPVQIGGRVFFLREDLSRWLDNQRDSRWNATVAKFTTRVSPTRAAGTMSRQESEILAQLRQQRRRSTGT